MCMMARLNASSWACAEMILADWLTVRAMSMPFSVTTRRPFRRAMTSVTGTKALTHRVD